MSVHVDVTINGEKVGSMEIVSQGPVDDIEAADPVGCRFYRYRYEGGGALAIGEGLRHRRSDGVWELVRRVLNRGQEPGAAL